MRVLLTNARFENRAGSELYIADVARWLRDHGHRPMIYSARPGPFAETIRRESIPVTSNLDTLGESPDVIHAHHHLATMSALAAFPLVPAVGFCHGWIPWEEAPARHPSIRRHVAVSGVTRERLVTEGGLAENTVKVIPNFVDLERFRPRTSLPESPRKALVLSNSARKGGWVDAVLAVCRERDIEVDVAGLKSGNPLSSPERVLPEYDLVFARGRSALEAMAVGAAVILCDGEGCGPFVTPAEFERLRDGNFGQAVMRQPHHGPYLGEQVDGYDVAAAGAASDRVRTELGRDRLVPEIIDIYREAMADVRARPHTMEDAQAAEREYLPWLDHNYPRPVLDSFRDLDRRVHELRAAHGKARARASAAEARVGTVQARADRAQANSDRRVQELEAARDKAGARASAAEARVGTLQARAKRAQADLDGLQSGFLVGSVLPSLWRFRERVAPTGSRRHRLYQAVRSPWSHRPRVPSRETLRQKAIDVALDRGPYASSDLRVHTITARLYWLASKRQLAPRVMRVPGRSLRVRRVHSLPQLAWAAVVTASKVDVVVGPGVEETDAGVFEGVWDGDFKTFQPHLSDHRFGTGVVQGRDDGRVRFVGTTDGSDYRYVVRRRGRQTVVSNSLAFALRAADVDTGSPFFHEVARVLRARTREQASAGVDLARPLVASLGELRLYQVAYHDFEIDRSGSPRLIWTPPKTYFGDFASYRSFITAVAASLIENGADPHRRQGLTPITTISRGYDSVATSAIVAGLGCRDALTLGVEVYGRNDSGLVPGEKLGLDVETFAHVMGPTIAELDAPFPPELAERAYEFIATAGLGDDVYMLPFEPRLGGKVMFSGAGGDSTWERTKPKRAGMPARGRFGRSYTEFRLRVGFALIHFPGVGARFVPPINRLTSSEELSPFSVGGRYDRPIARRIAEEAGVPREAFGQAKTATSPLPLNRAELFPKAMATTMRRYDTGSTQDA